MKPTSVSDTVLEKQQGCALVDLDELNNRMTESFGAGFQLAIEFTDVDEIRDRGGRRRVRYTVVQDGVAKIARGVYVIVRGAKDAVYVGSFTRSLARRWLYSKQGHIYQRGGWQLLQ